MNTTLPPGFNKLVTGNEDPQPDKRVTPVTRRKRSSPPPLKEVKRKVRVVGVKDHATLNSFLRKLPSQHKKYKLPVTQGMTMASYLRRLGLKLGWNRVRLDHLLEQ